MKNVHLTIIYVSLCIFQSSGQKLQLTHEVYNSWKILENAIISNDGKWVCYEKNPLQGDGWMMLYNTQKGKTDSVARGKNPVFSPQNQYLVFRITPQYDTIRSMKLKKVKKEKLPKDTLAIWFLYGDSIQKYPFLKSFKVPETVSGTIAALFENDKDNRKEKKDSSENRKDAKKDSKQVKSYLMIINPIENWQYRFEHVDEYTISKNGSKVLFRQITKDSLDTSRVLIFNTKTQELKKIYEGTLTVKNLTLDDEGQQAAFIVSADTMKQKAYSLYLLDIKSDMAKLIVDSLSYGMNKNWCVSENGKMYFSKDGRRLYFNTCPKPQVPAKDTLLEEEKYKLDIWKWDDKKLQSQQNKELQDELARSYLAVYDIIRKDIFQIETPEAKRSVIYQKGNSRYALLFGNENYLMEISWTGSVKNDVWLVDLEKKSKTLIFKATESTINLSPNQKFLFWYNRSDSDWYVKPVNSGHEINLTSSLSISFWNEEFDLPDFPPPYGFAGWTEQDEFILIYDRYDIWQFDPARKNKPVNITQYVGRNNQLTLRYVSLDKEEESISLKHKLLVKILDKKTMDEGFMFIWQDKKQWKNQLLIKEAYAYGKIQKAKNENVLLWQKETYRQYPELYISNADFTFPQQISITNPQQKNYLWGNVSLYYWTNEEGKENRGMLYVPDNFDSPKKYPMIVYYYERESENLHRHYIPKPSASVINFPLYNSNNYVIFVPDIWYRTGFPGESALTTVISGTKSLIAKGYIDEKKIGLQGQSWGGYQTAYIITRTDMFSAAMAGAAVSNMTSAYTGIRWESGLSRMFQYEKGQSRIGKTLWEDPQLYIQNSPVFYADKIKTPLLLMNNDNDGAVPWQQGIEMYSAMRRLQKPCWMLVYNNEEHNLKNWPNKVDLSIRMLQFFDHYLKDQPMPEWMKNSIPAIEKGKKSGY